MCLTTHKQKFLSLPNSLSYNSSRIHLDKALKTNKKYSQIKSYNLVSRIKQEILKRSSDSLNDCDGNGHSFLKKKPKQERDLGFAVPDRGCLAPVPLRTAPPPLTYNDHQEGHVGAGNNNKNNNNKDNQVAAVPVVRGCKQFWKAGDYEGGSVADSSADHSVGMDHVRVHPKFLHSNATSHKWALGAFAELLDNAVDEVGHGASCVSIDVLNNSKDFSKMLLVEDNGGGMTPDRMRACISLGYSAKSKMANTSGQYGNGFKTSTMRLGADVIVFSRCRGDRGWKKCNTKYRTAVLHIFNSHWKGRYSGSND